VPSSAPKIRVVGDPVLHTPAQQVTHFDEELAALIAGMFAATAVAQGVGLAAPQVGVSLAVFVYDCPDETGARRRGHVVNPSIETSGASELHEEGCLSVPGPYAELARAERATVRGVDKTGAPVEVSGSGYFARCLQHEVDHLDGKVFLDRLTGEARKTALRALRER
jgi:peptide deformylase